MSKERDKAFSKMSIEELETSDYLRGNRTMMDRLVIPLLLSAWVIVLYLVFA